MDAMNKPHLIDIGQAHFEWSVGGHDVIDGLELFEISIGHISQANPELFRGAVEAVKFARDCQAYYMMNTMLDRIESKYYFQGFSVVVVTQMIA